MTNRDFLRTLSSEEMADFLAGGLVVKYADGRTREPFVFDIFQIKRSNMYSKDGVLFWLDNECVFEVVR